MSAPPANDGQLGVLLVDCSDRGGIARYTQCLRAGLQDRGVDVALAAPAPIGDPGLELHARRWGPEMSAKSRAALYARRLAELGPSIAALRRALRRSRPDVVHFQTEIVPGVDHLVLRAVSRRVPVVLTVHDPIPLEGGARMVADQARRWQAADALVIHGEEPRFFVEASAPGVAVHVVPVDLPLGGPAPSRETARRRLGLDGAPVALLLGQLRPYKGLRILADAWPRVVETLPRARLLLVGERYPSPDLDQLAATAGVDIRPGFLADEEIDVWAAAADALVLPYYSGVHSGILHRGIAAGTPVLASPVLAEEVTRTRAGEVVALDASAWAQALVAALGDAPLPAPPAPSGDRTVGGTLSVYHQVLARRGAGKATAPARPRVPGPGTETG